MSARAFVKSITSKRLPLVATMESVFGTLAGTPESATSAADRLALRAANDAEQR